MNAFKTRGAATTRLVRWWSTPVVAAVLVSIGILLGAPQASAGAVIAPPDPGTVMACTSRCSEGPVLIGFPVNLGSFDYYPEVRIGLTGDQLYEDLYVNTNGSVTFDAPNDSYPGFSFCNQAPIIAPFWSDVDTWSGTITYGQTTHDDDRKAFFVTWSNVGSTGASTPTNTFQLLLVDRSVLGDDTTVGDFDIIFNYDEISWDCSLGTTCEDDPEYLPAAGFAFNSFMGEEGFGGTQVLLPGSVSCLTDVGTPGALLDSNPTTGLIHNHRNSGVPGRYIFGIRGGQLAGNGRIHGAVVDEDSNDVANCRVTARRVVPGGYDVTYTTLTDEYGEYDLAGIAEGEYTVFATPPWDSALFPEISSALVEEPFLDAWVYFMLTGPTPMPPEVTIAPVRIGARGVPTVYWSEPLTLEADGCPGGTATYSLTAEGSGPITDTMAEDPAGSGHYVAVIPPVHPAHGYGTLVITIDCPDSADDIVYEFDIYIDPSGTVIDGCTGEPIPGVTVTLLYTNDLALPFAPVPDGSTIMSPDNRTNPDLTDAAGAFGWDTVPGYYKVRAEKAGYVSALGDSYVETEILPVPPEHLGLELFLQGAGPCGTGTLRAALEAQRADLAAIPDGKHLEKAVKELDKALSDKYWQPDGNHLTKHGKEVLQRIAKAVKELGKIDPQTPEITAAIHSLCDIAHTLAQTEIEAAIARGGDPKHIAKAQKELHKGEDHHMNGECPKAIDHYKKAWHHAFKA